MPRAFDITPSAPKLQLKSGESGEIAFTVSNKLDRPVRAKAVARPDGETKESWLSITGGNERDFARDETQLITVKVQVPPGVKEGSYDFHMVVSSLAEPDEVYAVGGTVPIVVKHVEQRPFPWWIVILAGGLLLIGGVTFGLVKALGDGDDTQQQPPGANCASDADCPGNQRCVEVQPGAKACLLKPGEDCTANIQCASAFCRPEPAGGEGGEGGMRCSRDDGQCTPETAEQDCRPGVFECVGNRCRLVLGQPCQDHLECVSDFCSGGRCAPCSVRCIPPLVCRRNQCVLIRDHRDLRPALEEFRRFQGLEGIQQEPQQ